MNALRIALTTSVYIRYPNKKRLPLTFETASTIKIMYFKQNCLPEWISLMIPLITLYIAYNMLIDPAA